MQSRTCKDLAALVVDRQPWVCLLLGKMKRTHFSGVPRTGFILSGSRVCWWKVLAELGCLFLIFSLQISSPQVPSALSLIENLEEAIYARRKLLWGLPQMKFKCFHFVFFHSRMAQGGLYTVWCGTSSLLDGVTLLSLVVWMPPAQGTKLEAAACSDHSGHQPEQDYGMWPVSETMPSSWVLKADKYQTHCRICPYWDVQKSYWV